ncbi:hypothetical protein D6833_00760, partial [Candidatus Parcubacteria bacterium]
MPKKPFIAVLKAIVPLKINPVQLAIRAVLKIIYKSQILHADQEVTQFWWFIPDSASQSLRSSETAVHADTRNDTVVAVYFYDTENLIYPQVLAEKELE